MYYGEGKHNTCDRKIKIELGCGNRPTEGYLHQDIIQLDTRLDFLCPAWDIQVDENTVSEVIAIAVMEHLRIEDFRKTIKKIHKILEPGGVFYFDVPDIFIWSAHLFDVLRGSNTPYSKTDVYKTIVGWNRWPGDEHKSLWTREDIYYELEKVGFKVSDGLEDIKERVHRDRFNPEYVKTNAHIFIKAIK